ATPAAVPAAAAAVDAGVPIRSGASREPASAASAAVAARAGMAPTAVTEGTVAGSAAAAAAATSTAPAAATAAPAAAGGAARAAARSGLVAVGGHVERDARTDVDVVARVQRDAVCARGSDRRAGRDVQVAPEAELGDRGVVDVRHEELRAVEGPAAAYAVDGAEVRIDVDRQRLIGLGAGDARPGR